MGSNTDDREQTLATIAERKREGARIVFTNGCFDLIHVGHVRYLADARALGDILVVGLNSDSSVGGLKGPERPIVPQDERAEVLRSLRAVDFVVVFDEVTPAELIRAVEPDVLVKGGDWPVEKIVGADFVMSRGGEVRSLAFVPGRSSSALIERIKKL